MLSDRLVLGTASLGVSGREIAFELLDEFYRLGGRTIDTAWVYSDWVPGETGRSENTLGAWMADRGNRNELTIVTKGAHPIIGTTRGRLDSASIRADVDTSLQRLRTDRLDFWLVHKDDPSQPVPEIVGTLQELQNSGKILAFGCSNWKLPRMEQALAIPGAKFTANQVLGNVFCGLIPGAPDPTNEIIDATMFHHARESGMTLFLYSATAHGYFERCASGRAPAREYDIPAVASAASRLEAIAAEAGVEPSGMILATLLQLGGHVRPIIGPRTAEQLRACWKGGELTLPPGVVRKVVTATGMGDFIA